MKHVLIFAHRGASGYAPDNTREAFELAIKMGTNAIESDVKLTRDHHLVFFHDTFVGKGIHFRPICLITLKHLQGFDLGNGARVPKVEDIFAQFRDQPITWSIDTKGKKQGAELVTLAKKYQMLDRVFIVNEGYQIKKKWEQAGMPGDHYIWSIREKQIKRLGVERLVKVCQDWGIRILNVKLEWMTPRLQQAIVAGGIKLFIWDCHNEQNIKAALAFQPAAIYSNYPDLALKYAQP